MSYTKLLYHIVFSTKERRAFLKGDTLPRVRDYVAGIIHSEGGQVLASDGAEDHLHLALALPPAMAIADLVRKAKAGSSKWVHQELAGLKSFAWQDGYAAFSVSPSVLPQVVRYIQGQGEHHKKVSLTDELRRLLEKHGIAYEEKYL